MEHARNKGMTVLSKGEGFTLVELIMALTVVSVALTGLIAMFGMSLETADESRQKTFAADIATTELAGIQAVPESFIWEYDKVDEQGLFPILLGADDPKAGNLTAPPDVKLVNRNIHARNELMYRKFRWKAWGRLPSPDAKAYEVTVDVHWENRGRERSLALTSSIPLYRVPVNVAAAEGATP